MEVGNKGSIPSREEYQYETSPFFQHQPRPTLSMKEESSLASSTRALHTPLVEELGGPGALRSPVVTVWLPPSLQPGPAQPQDQPGQPAGLLLPQPLVLLLPVPGHHPVNGSLQPSTQLPLLVPWQAVVQGVVHWGWGQ